MPRPIPPPLSLALTHLRTARGWTQQDLAAAAGLTSQRICDLEMGIRRTLSREQLERLIAAMDYGPEDVTLALVFVGGLVPPREARPPSPLDPTPSDLRRARRIAARVGMTETSRMYAQLLGLGRLRRLEQARREAGRQWEVLRELPPAEQLELLVGSPDLWHWALVERLDNESIRAAADDGARALHLATLAVRAAELAPGDERWRSALQGWAWGFVGNAQRVSSDHLAAEASFATAWRFWHAVGPDLVCPLGEWRLLDLEASLRRDRRQFAAALDLLERALAAAPATDRGRILLKKEFTLEQAGELDAALVVLEEAAPLIEAGGDPHLRWSLGMNRIVMLAHLDRLAEAEACLPELRTQAIELGRRLDLIRIVWLAARIAIGQGRRGDARAWLEQARRDFAAVGDVYNVALLALELAVLDLEDGNTTEVAALAGEMIGTFRSLRVERETLAGLRLFCQAARAQTATAAMARSLIEQLTRAVGGSWPRPEEAA
ncbi:MAG TPA: helix-turn-helix domain-containing protein [Thermoanaerobaculia bacterium]|nr:helix-turn-helix domain-containing protein [Thermoanaerobaculia bacterium]